MRISVIIPVYNVRPYLEEAVESIRRQTHTGLEIILVDDGSTDGSGELCDRFAETDDRVRVIHQPNRGLSAARNAGLDRMSGEAVAFLDPDDVFHPDMLRKMSGAMAEQGADIVECGYAIHRGDRHMELDGIDCGRRRAVGREGLHGNRDALVMQLRGEIAACVWNKLYRSTLWDGLRFRRGQNYEDVDIILPLLERAGSVYCLGDVLIVHRKRPGSITATVTYENIRDRALAYRHYAAYVLSRVPDRFDAGDGCRAAEKRYDALLVNYFVCAGSRFSEKKETLDFLREEISDAARDVAPGGCRMKTRIASVLYSYTPPAAAGRAYRVFRRLKKLMRRVTGRSRRVR